MTQHGNMTMEGRCGHPYRIVLLLVAIGAASGCLSTSRSASLNGSGEASAERLTLTGSSTVAPLAAEIAKRWESRHPECRVDVQSGGSSRGIADVLSGAADIGMVSRGLQADETAQGLVPHTFARDGVGIIVHADNPIRSLQDEQVVGIYTGRIRDWKEVGAPGGPIVVVHKAEGRATLEVFLRYFGLNNADIRADIIGGENQQVIQTVAGNRHAIGYVSVGEAEAEAKHGTPIHLVALHGVEATRANVAAGTFPMSRPLQWITLGEPRGVARRFIEFTQSEEVHDLVARFGFIPAGN